MNHKILLICLLPILAISINFPMFKQCDPKWANEQLGTSSNTICRAGCLMSSAAMALAGTVQKSFNPSTLNTWLKSHGGYVQQDLYVWASINPLGLVFTGFLANGDIAKKLNDGGIVILNVHNGGHWVLATGISGNTIYVNDPGYSTTSYSMSEIVAGNTGGYRIANSRLGMMIGEL